MRGLARTILLASTATFSYLFWQRTSVRPR